MELRALLGSRRLLITGLAVVVVILAAVVLAARATASTPSAKHFCGTFRTEQDKFNEKYGNKSEHGDLLTSVDRLAGSMSAVLVIWDKLVKVAPEEIAPDVTWIRDTIKGSIQRGAAGDPLGAIVTGMMAADSYKNVQNYIDANCYTPEERAAAEKSKADAAKQAQTKTATNDLESFLGYLDQSISKINAFDLTYVSTWFNQLDSYVNEAETALKQAKAAVKNDSKSFCTEGGGGTWGGYLDTVELATENMRNLAKFPGAVVADPKELDTAAAEQARTALANIDPSAPALASADAKITTAKKLAETVKAANEAAIAKAKGYVAKADTLAAEGEYIGAHQCDQWN